MIDFQNEFIPRQVAARPAAAKPKAAPPVVAGRAVKTSARQPGGSPAGTFRFEFEAQFAPPSLRPGTTPAPPAQPTARPAATGGGFQRVFENDVLPPLSAPKSQPSIASAKGAAGGKAGPTATGGGFQRVFENDVLPPLSAPKSQSASASAKGAPRGKAGNVPLWDNGGFGFSDILDVINPLQHLPFISSIYRNETGDQIGAVPRVLGSMLFGGGLIGAVVGAATAVINLAVKQETGKDIGSHIYTALFGQGGRNAKTTTIAARPAQPSAVKTPAPVTVKGQTPLAPPSAKPAKMPASAKPIRAPARAAPAPATPASTNPAPAAPAPTPKAGPPPGGVRITGKAAPPTSLSTAAAKTVSNQFRRSAWYRKNQDMLAAQAKELARAKAKAATSVSGNAGTGGNGPRARTATGRPDMLRLFISKAAAGKTGGTGAKSKSATGAPAAVAKAAVALEMSKALAKYEKLLKSRVAGGTKANQLK